MSKSARRIQVLSIEEELGASFGRYAEKVILDRAIPDVRDGLKPVQRRIVYAMYDAGNLPDRPYRKCARTVGDVMGKYHPHGDSSIYQALVRMAQPWKMRYPLVDGHGNFGSMDDDPPAAMRYTEARLSPIALELLTDLDKDTVEWRPNFDDKETEPVVLPAGYLNLLVNGTSGVSAGFATDIPSHNLGEVVDACVALLRNPDLTSRDLMLHVKGPDFPTGGIVMGAEGMQDAYETGKGKVVLRARHEYEKTRDGKTLIVFTEIPYNVVKSELVRQMDALRLDKEVHGVLDCRDESDRNGLRLVIEVSRSGDPDGILAFFLKKTDLQINYHFNMVAIHRATPRQMELRDIVRALVEHRREVIRRRSAHDLAKAQHRLHEVEGLIRAIDMLDEVIATIRASRDRADARANLVALGFTEVQSDAILDLRLVRLTNLQLSLLTGERDELRRLIAGLEAILGDPDVLDGVVERELIGVKERHGDPRRTTIEEEVETLEVALEVMVKPQEVVVGVTREGWIKRASLASFNAMGGDRKSSGVRPGDRMLRIIPTNTTHTLLVFGSEGNCYPVPVHTIPESKWAEMGTSMVNVCGIGQQERVVDVIPRATFPEDQYILFATIQGQVKATPISEFESTRSSGIIAIKLDEGDRLADVAETVLEGEALCMTDLGQGIRYRLEEVSIQGRNAKGVRGMKVKPGEELHDVLLVREDPDLYIATFTQSGRAKLTPLEDYPLQRRGGKGVRMITSRSKQPHRCVRLAACRMSDKFEVIDSGGQVHEVPAQRIPVTRRDGNAWTMIQLKGGAKVMLVEQVPVEPDPPPAAEAEPEAED